MMSRRTAAQTRGLILDTALRMLHEQGPSAGVSHIRLSDAVGRAGLTTGAAYRLWDDQQAFHDELAITAMRWRDADSTARTEQAIGPVMTAGGPWQEVIRRGSEANLQTFPDEMAFLTMLALRVSAYRQPELVSASRQRHAEAMQAYGRLYAAVLTFYRRRMRPPFTLEHLCSAFAALAEGFQVQAACGEPHPRIDIDRGTAGIGTEWTLLAVAAEALLEAMTEPQ
jgi:AcrR family transcriptional regulator